MSECGAAYMDTPAPVGVVSQLPVSHQKGTTTAGEAAAAAAAVSSSSSDTQIKQEMGLMAGRERGDQLNQPPS